MKLRKIYFETEDKIELCGLLHEPEKETCEIVIAVHGMQSNCLKKREDIIAGELTDNGIAYFTFNNRGHDLVNLTNKRCDDKSFKIQCGTSLENIEDSYYDIKAAINSMLTEKYKKIHLQGHSLGCTKIVYSYNRMKQQNDNEILDKIESIILLSMVDIPCAIKFLFAGNIESLTSYMEKEQKEGRGQRLVAVSDNVIPMCPNTFLKYVKYNDSINFARYSEDNYEFKELNEINVPLFMRWGNNNELILQKADELSNAMSNKIKNNNKDIGFIDGATHNYKGKEKILANQILEFIKNNHNNNN